MVQVHLNNLKPLLIHVFKLPCCAKSPPLLSQRVVCLKYVVVTRNKQACDFDKHRILFLGWIVFFWSSQHWDFGEADFFHSLTTQQEGPEFEPRIGPSLWRMDLCGFYPRAIKSWWDTAVTSQGQRGHPTLNTVTQERGGIGLGKVGISVTLNNILDVYLLSDMKILSGSLLTVCSKYCCLLAFGELGWIWCVWTGSLIWRRHHPVISSNSISLWSLLTSFHPCHWWPRSSQHHSWDHDEDQRSKSVWWQAETLPWAKCC